MKNLYIAEKPSVARQFADVLGVKGNAGAGYLESEDSVVTWCVGHLITMSYPDAYDEKLKKMGFGYDSFYSDRIQIRSDTRCQQAVQDRSRAVEPG